jgi:putative acetyltransferase
MLKIRTPKPRERAAIRAVNISAYGRPDEADLVDLLRADGDAAIELVAQRGREIVGHILFSPLGLAPAPEDAPRLLALAPLAVTPDMQRQGVGAELVRRGVEACRAAAAEAVIVLGHHNYYPRFGFSAAQAARLNAPFSGESFMALELAPGALERASGRITYARAFGLRERA